jgi:hypothetical protein
MIQPALGPAFLTAGRGSDPSSPAALIDKPCGACAGDTWTIASKNLEAVGALAE